MLIYAIVFLAPHYRYDGGFVYARKMAAKAARPAMAIELPVVLAAPLKAWMGELVGLGTALKDVLVDCLSIVRVRWRIAYPVPVATPEAVPAGAPPAGEPTGAGEPGTGGTAVPAGGEPAGGAARVLATWDGTPDGDSTAGVLAAGDGVTVTVWTTVTAAGQVGQVGQADETGATGTTGAALVATSTGVLTGTTGAAGELLTGTTGAAEEGTSTGAAELLTGATGADVVAT